MTGDFWTGWESVYDGPVSSKLEDIGAPQWNRMFLYLLRAKDGALLYVGITWNVKGRWHQHRQKKRWWPEVRSAEVYSITAASEPDAVRAARDIERRCMLAFSPAKNLHGPASLPSKALS